MLQGSRNATGLAESVDKKNGAVTLREAKTKEHAIREKVREIDRGVDSEPKKKKKSDEIISERRV